MVGYGLISDVIYLVNLAVLINGQFVGEWNQASSNGELIGIAEDAAHHAKEQDWEQCGSAELEIFAPWYSKHGRISVEIAGQAGLITSLRYSNQDRMNSNCVNELVYVCVVFIISNTTKSCCLVSHCWDNEKWKCMWEEEFILWGNQVLVLSFVEPLDSFCFLSPPPSLVMEAVRSYSTTLETLLYFKKRAHFLVCRQHVNQLSLFRTCLRQSLLLPSGQAKGWPWRTLLSLPCWHPWVTLCGEQVSISHGWDLKKSAPS